MRVKIRERRAGTVAAMGEHRRRIDKVLDPEFQA